MMKVSFLVFKFKDDEFKVDELKVYEVKD